MDSAGSGASTNRRGSSSWYGIAPGHWGRGLATEAAVAMIRYGFDVLGFARIQASTDAANTASVRVMERAGLRFWKREMTNGLDTIHCAIHRPQPVSIDTACRIDS